MGAPAAAAALGAGGVGAPAVALGAPAAAVGAPAAAPAAALGAAPAAPGAPAAALVARRFELLSSLVSALRAPLGMLGPLTSYALHGAQAPSENYPGFLEYQIALNAERPVSCMGMVFAAKPGGGGGAVVVGFSSAFDVHLRQHSCPAR